jgi:hypothetical protein
MSHIKVDCDYCPHPHRNSFSPYRDWETHPSLINGLEALNAYSDWVSSVVLPIAFQWVDENRTEVYASIPDNLKDDVGTVIAAAFRLVRERDAYKRGMEKSAAYETTVVNGDTSKLNPVWASVAQKVRTCTEEVFADQSSLQVDLPE